MDTGVLMPSTSPLALDLISDLKAVPVSAMPTIVLLVGATTLTDGLGGFYRWTPDSTASEDTRFYNVVTSNMSTTGRWVRVFQRIRSTSGGYLVLNGGFKSFFYPTSTNSSGQATVNLTMDGTTGGAAMFTEIWTTQGDGAAAGTTANDSVIGTRKSVSPDLKQLTYQFVRGANTTLSGLLGIVVPGLQTAPGGTAVVLQVNGI